MVATHSFCGPWHIDLERAGRDVQDWMLEKLNGAKSYSPFLDTYISVRFEKDDPRSRSDRTDYWANLWGKGWDNWLTGYAVVRLGDSDVGLRLVT